MAVISHIFTGQCPIVYCPPLKEWKGSQLSQISFPYITSHCTPFGKAVTLFLRMFKLSPQSIGDRQLHFLIKKYFYLFLGNPLCIKFIFILSPSPFFSPLASPSSCPSSLYVLLGLVGLLISYERPCSSCCLIECWLSLLA